MNFAFQRSLHYCDMIKYTCNNHTGFPQITNIKTKKVIFSNYTYKNYKCDFLKLQIYNYTCHFLNPPLSEGRETVVLPINAFAY